MNKYYLTDSQGNAVAETTATNQQQARLYFYNLGVLPRMYSKNYIIIRG